MITHTGGLLSLHDFEITKIREESLMPCVLASVPTQASSALNVLKLIVEEEDLTRSDPEESRGFVIDFPIRLGASKELRREAAIKTSHEWV